MEFKTITEAWEFLTRHIGEGFKMIYDATKNIYYVFKSK